MDLKKFQILIFLYCLFNSNFFKYFVKILARYSARRASALSLYKGKKSPIVVPATPDNNQKNDKKNLPNSPSQTKQEPSKNVNSQKNNKNNEKFSVNNKKNSEPVVDVGFPSTLTSVPIVHRSNHKDIVFENLPSLPSSNNIMNDPRNTNTMSLVEKKIRICTVMCDFSDPSADTKAKSTKTHTLSELDVIFSNVALVQRLPPQIVDSYFEMLMKNIMRDLPPVKKEYLIFDDEPVLVDINWPHLQIIYKQFLNFQQLHPNKITNSVVSKMLTRIHAPDAEEREQVLCFFRYYVLANPAKTTTIFKKFSYILQDYINRNCYPFAVTPILKFYLIQFPLQFKDGQLLITIFSTSILPLLSCQHIISYYGVLLQIIQFFIAVDPAITPQIIRRVLLYWPQSNPTKQILFISLISLLMENLSRSEFEKMSKRIFRLLSDYALSSNAKVAEASLLIWSNIKIIPKILDNTRTIFPITFPQFSKTAREHWNPETQTLATNTLKSMHDLDPFLYDEITQTSRRSSQSIISQTSSSSTLTPLGKTSSIGGLSMSSNRLDILPKDSEANAHKNWALIARTAAKTDRAVNLAKILTEIQKQFNKPNGELVVMPRNDAIRKFGTTFNSRIGSLPLPPPPPGMTLNPNLRH